MLNIDPPKYTSGEVIRPYRDPGSDKTVILATQEGASQLFWSVTVMKSIPDWGPNKMLRLEGVTSYMGERCQVIAWYHLDSVEDGLGTMQLHAPE